MILWNFKRPKFKNSTIESIKPAIKFDKPDSNIDTDRPLKAIFLNSEIEGKEGNGLLGRMRENVSIEMFCIKNNQALECGLEWVPLYTIQGVP